MGDSVTPGGNGRPWTSAPGRPQLLSCCDPRSVHPTSFLGISICLCEIRAQTWNQMVRPRRSRRELMPGMP